MAVIRRGRTWRVQVTMPTKDPRTGKRKRMCWTFDSEEEARDFEGRKYQEFERLAEQHVRPSVTPLGQYLSDWLRRKENEQLAARTLYSYRYHVEKLITPALGKLALAEVSPMLVQQWQDSLAPTRDSRGATLAAAAFRTLRSALSDAERLCMIARNPAKVARPALRTRNKRPGFTLQEAHALMAAADGERLATLFAFVLHSGLRVAEALGLRWADVDLDSGVLSVRRNLVETGGRMVEGKPKTEHSARTFALLPQAIDDLTRHTMQQGEDRLRAGQNWRDRGAVFATAAGGPLQTSNVDRVFVRVRERTEVRPLPLSSLRHASASILLNSGVPVAVAAKMMGHSFEMFTETYADLLVEATREAAARAGAFLAAHAPKTPEKAAVVSIGRGRRRRASV